MKHTRYSLLISLLFGLLSQTNAQPLYRWADVLPGFSTYALPSQNQAGQMFVDKHFNVYVTGSFTRGLDMDPGPLVDTLLCASQGGYFAKYDSSGNLIWAHTFGYSGGGAAGCTLGDSGYYYLSGATGGLDSFGLGSSVDTTSVQGFFVAKYDSFDHLVWVKVTPCASDGDLYSVKTDRAGNVYAAGQFNATTDFDPAHPGTVVFTNRLLDGFIIKYGPDGSFKWARQISGNDGDRAVDLALDPSGNVLVTGYFAGLASMSWFGDTGGTAKPLYTNGNYDAFAAKYDSSGAIVWLKQLGGAGTDYGYGISTDSKSNVYVSGIYAGSMIVDSAAHDTLNTGYNNAGFLVKLSPSGKVLWAQNYGCDTGYNLYASLCSVATDDSDNVYATGSFQGSVLLNPAGPRIYQLGGVVGPGEDYFVVKMDSTGAYKWSTHINSKRDDEPEYIYVDAANSIYVTGYVTDTTDFNPGGSGGVVGFPMPNVNWTPVSFFSKYDQMPVRSTTNVKNVATASLSAFPNPVRQQLTLKGDIEADATISICDMLGRSFTLPENTEQDRVIITTQQLVPGVYILQYAPPGKASYRVEFIKE